MKKKGFAGFTLIELLVVIAIIAILAAILWPIYTRVKETGRTNTCRSHLAQLGKAFEQYRADATGYPPNGEYYQDLAGKDGDQSGTIPTKLHTFWVEKMIKAGMAQAPIFKCPSDTGTGDLSYVYNQYFVYTLSGYPYWSTPENRWCVIPPNFQTVLSPSKVIVFGEWENGWQKDPPHADDVSSRRSGWFTYAPPANTADKRHLGKGNYAFWDGHVETLAPEQVGRDSGGGGGADIQQSITRGPGPPFCCLDGSPGSGGIPGAWVIPWWGPGGNAAKVKSGGQDKYILRAASWCSKTGTNIWTVKGNNMTCAGAFYPSGVNDLNFTALAGSNRPSWDKEVTWVLGLEDSQGPGPNGSWLVSVVDQNEPHYRYPWGTMPTFNPNW